MFQLLDDKFHVPSGKKCIEKIGSTSKNSFVLVVWAFFPTAKRNGGSVLDEF